jgi:hypothetical protein
MLILDKARTLDLMISRSERILVPEAFTAAFVPPPVPEEDAGAAVPLPAMPVRELAVQPALPYSTTWMVPTIP